MCFDYAATENLQLSANIIMAGVTAKCNSDCESSTSESTNDKSLCRDNSTTSSKLQLS